MNVHTARILQTEVSVREQNYSPYFDFVASENVLKW